MGAVAFPAGAVVGVEYQLGELEAATPVPIAAGPDIRVATDTGVVATDIAVATDITVATAMDTGVATDMELVSELDSTEVIILATTAMALTHPITTVILTLPITAATIPRMEEVW